VKKIKRIIIFLQDKDALFHYKDALFHYKDALFHDKDALFPDEDSIITIITLMT